MPADLSIEIRVGDVIETLTIMREAVEHPAGLMTDVLLVMVRATNVKFEREGIPRWDDLAESTEIARGRRASRGTRGRRMGSLFALGSINILRDTGALFASVGGGASGAFESGLGFGDSDDFTAIIGTSQPGWQNQFPDSRGWRPARVFLDWQDQEEADVADLAIAWLMRMGPYAA